MVLNIRDVRKTEDGSAEKAGRGADGRSTFFIGDISEKERLKSNC